MRVEEGCAVYSRFPIVTHDYILLPRDRSDNGDVHQRVVFRLVVATPFGELQVAQRKKKMKKKKGKRNKKGSVNHAKESA